MDWKTCKERQPSSSRDGPATSRKAAATAASRVSRAWKRPKMNSSISPPFRTLYTCTRPCDCLFSYPLHWSILTSSDASGRADRFCAEFPPNSLLGELVPCAGRKNSLLCLRREFIHKHLTSLMYSRRIFAKGGRFREIPCLFRCDQGIMAVT